MLTSLSRFCTLFLLITGAVAAWIDLKARDPCLLAAQDLKESNATSYERAVQCLDSFPFQDSDRLSILDSLQKALDFYVFKDITTYYQDTSHPSSPIHMEYDIQQQLQHLVHKMYIKEREFHDDVFDLFSQLYDPHTRYISQCYHRWSFIQPWVLTSFTVKEEQAIYIRHLVFQEAHLNAFWSVDVSQYVGWKVTHIHNVPAIQAIASYAQESITMARDPQVRFNLALGRVAYQQGDYKPIFGYFTVRHRPPTKDHVTYTLMNPHTRKIVKLKIPFMAQGPKKLEFTHRHDYYQQQCMFNRDPRYILDSDAKQHNHGFNLYQFEPSMDISPSSYKHYLKSGARKVDFDLLDHPISKSTVDAFYKLDPHIGVLKLGSFHDDTKNEYLILRHWIRQLRQFKAENVTHLIIDVSDNAGGYICLGNALLSYLLAQSRPSVTDLIVGNMFEEIAYKVEEQDDSVFHYNCDSIDPDTLLPPRNSTWMHQGPFYQRGRRTSQYTQKIMFNCNSFYKELPQQTQPPWPASQMAIISNGFCGSTCAVFTRGLVEGYGVNVYGVGGMGSTLMGYSEFAGGQVYSLGALMLDFYRARLLDHPDLPRPFPVASLFSFTIREVYSKHYPDIPMEFSKLITSNTHL